MARWLLSLSQRGPELSDCNLLMMSSVWCVSVDRCRQRVEANGGTKEALVMFRLMWICTSLVAVESSRQRLKASGNNNRLHTNEEGDHLWCIVDINIRLAILFSSWHLLRMPTWRRCNAIYVSSPNCWTSCRIVYYLIYLLTILLSRYKRTISPYSL